MKKINHTKQHNLNSITEELFAAFPEWVKPDAVSGEQSTSVSISGDGSTLNLWVPDNADEGAIRAVIDAHDPTKESKGEKVSRELQEAQVSVRGKFKVLGLTDREIDAVLGVQDAI